MALRDSRFISCVRFVRKLRGGSQAELVEASDGLQYVVKSSDSPQGPQVVLHEALGTGLYRCLGLAVPEWTPIEISAEYISANPCAWYQELAGIRRPRPGLAFASRAIGSQQEPPLEIVPRSWYARIRNRKTFWGALAVDFWAEHTDNRQALFLSNTHDQSLNAFFIDHGHMFGRSTKRKSVSYNACRYLDRPIYENDGAESLEYWIQQIESQAKSIVDTALAALPESWVTKYVLEIAARLIKRASQLRPLKTMVRDMFENAIVETGFSERQQPGFSIPAMQ